MRLELKDFVQATRSMHQQPGGVKRTRLMLRLRPYQSRKTFVLKATDGRVTMTTRVEHQGQIKMVESLVNEFVTECTRASVGSPVPSTATASAGEQQAANAAAASSVSAASGHKDRKRVYRNASKTRDPFLRDGTVSSRFFRSYRTQLPFPARMFGIFLVGFSLGLVLEVFACKTHLYESVMMKKDARRHEFDEFVVDFRQNVERWQREDMGKRQSL
ncbi:hypothetical protein CGC20_37195 [Leishmania donovani]|uniref:Uncharacterized protein n=1 Tax=Leishmania donovani TaxID=5661 RepID=A0A504XGJ8_LEIDO|nr:hypothetical protein CGC20_37195 [Leishmania donovani]